MSYEADAAKAAGAVSRSLVPVTKPPIPVLPKKGCIQYAMGPDGLGMNISATALPDAEGRVYLSGPILGETYESARYGWRKLVALQLLPGIQVLSPMRHEGHLAEHTGPINNDIIDSPTHFFAGAKIIVEKDMLDIRRCDLVLVNLLGATKVSIGTVSEMGMAFAMDKTIITVIEPDNIHQHPFVTETSSLVLDNLDDAIYAINSLLSVGI